MANLPGQIASDLSRRGHVLAVAFLNVMRAHDSINVFGRPHTAAQIRREFTFGDGGVMGAPRFSPYLLRFLRLFAAILLTGYSNRAIVSSYDVVENQRRQAAVPVELSSTIVLGRGGSVSLGGFCRQLKQTVLPIRS